MQRFAPFIVLAALAAGFSSCATEEELRERRKPPEPTTTTSKIPWNAPIGTQGAGQMGMMMQNQLRR